jgi:hypothetical protein
MRKVTLRKQGMEFTFAIHSRASKTSARGNVSDWVKVRVIRHGQTVDYVYAKANKSMRQIGEKWLEGVA